MIFVIEFSTWRGGPAKRDPAAPQYEAIAGLNYYVHGLYITKFKK
jgi:hypothetical protein